MKKITLSILAAGLAAMTLASCGGDAVDTTAGSGNTTATPAVSVPTTKTPEPTTPATTATTPATTPASEVTTDPTVAPSTPAETSAEATTATTEPTPAPSTPKTNGGETIENLYYAIDVDITIIDGNAGIVFAGANNNNFVMWQLAIGEHNDGNLWLRPHTWVNGGGRCIEEIVLNEDVAGLENVSADYNVKHHMTIRVFKDGTVETLIDSVSVGTTDAVADMILTDTIGLIGFRCDAYNNGTIPEVGLFDNLKITDASGAVLYEDDFSSEGSTLCEALVDGNQVVLENGALKVSGKYLNMTDVEI